jgi:hypothetical protein
MALGTFLAFVEYRGWDGGVVGLKLHDLLHLLIGRTAALLPPILIAICVPSGSACWCCWPR